MQRFPFTVPWARVAAALGLAAIGGVIGASLMWMPTRQLGLGSVDIGLISVAVGLIVTAIGWFISARLTGREQTRLFQHNVINTARLDLAVQIREEQEWIGRLLGFGFRYRGALICRKQLPGVQDIAVETLFWVDQARAGHKILHREQAPGRTLTMLLEEYELLFPDTKRVRHQLSRLSQQIVQRYTDWLVYLCDPKKSETVIVALENRLNTEDGDYSALLEDLRVHIQNAALSKIMGRSVALRQPKDPKLPIMVMQSDGLLDVVQQGKSWPVMTEEQAKLIDRKVEGDL